MFKLNLSFVQKLDYRFQLPCIAQNDSIAQNDR